MKRNDGNIQLMNSGDEIQSYENYNNIIDKWSNLTFYDNKLNKTSFKISTPQINGMYHFTVSAERLLKSNSNQNSYVMLVFDIDKFSEISELHDNSVASELIAHIGSTLKTYIQEPNLYCRINDENYAILLENYKSIDVALLVIQLTEEITTYYFELKFKLAFGICIAERSDYDIPSLCKRAFYAKSTLKGQDQQLLANYNELIFQKRSVQN